MAQHQLHFSKLMDDEITIVHAQLEDLETIATQMYEVMESEHFWDAVEPRAIRPPELIRIQRLAKRMRPWTYQIGSEPIMAIHNPTGAIMGFALWHAPCARGLYPTSYPGLPGHTFPNNFAPSFSRDSRDVGPPLKWDVREGWSKQAMDEMWSGVTPAWQDRFAALDLARLRIMGERPHWYVGPLYVKKEWRGRGVASKLLRWGQSRALVQKLLGMTGELPPSFKDTSCYLETTPVARGLCVRAGFKEVEDTVMIWTP